MSIKYYVIRYLYTTTLHIKLGYEIIIAIIPRHRLHPDWGYIDNGYVDKHSSDY